MCAETVVGAELPPPCFLPPVGVGFGDDVGESLTASGSFFGPKARPIELDHFFLSSEINGFST